MIVIGIVVLFCLFAFIYNVHHIITHPFTYTGVALLDHFTTVAICTFAWGLVLYCLIRTLLAKKMITAEERYRIEMKRK